MNAGKQERIQLEVSLKSISFFFFFFFFLLIFSSSKFKDLLQRKAYLSRLMTKTNKVACAHSEDSDQAGHPPSLISSLNAQWVAKDPSFLHADSEDSDQTGRMPRLI